MATARPIAALVADELVVAGGVDVLRDEEIPRLPPRRYMVGRASTHAAGSIKAGKRDRMTMTKRIAALTTALVLGLSGVAAADPDFGPGNSSKGPNDGGAKCHPPGKTVNTPGCK